MITMWHSGYGDTPLGIYLSKNIHMLKSYPLDFNFATKLPVFDEHVLITITWWNISHWKVDNECNVTKKKAISSIKYFSHNKQLRNLNKFMPMNINQHMITLNIHITPDSDIILIFSSIFELKIRILMKSMAI